MTPIQLTLLTALVIMLASVLVYVWSSYRWLVNISKARVYLALEETEEMNRLIKKSINKANSQAKLMNCLHPFRLSGEIHVHPVYGAIRLYLPILAEFNRPPPVKELRYNYGMSHNEEMLTKIANEVLNIKSLETNNSDDQDFHDVAVWDVKQALEKAFALGIERGWQTKAQQ